jgi:hypothetical protein
MLKKKHCSNNQINFDILLRNSLSIFEKQTCGALYVIDDRMKIIKYYRYTQTVALYVKEENKKFVIFFFTLRGFYWPIRKVNE